MTASHRFGLTTRCLFLYDEDTSFDSYHYAFHISDADAIFEQIEMATLSYGRVAWSLADGKLKVCEGRQALRLAADQREMGGDVAKLQAGDQALSAAPLRVAAVPAHKPAPVTPPVTLSPQAR